MTVTREQAAEKVFYYVREYSDEQDVEESYKLDEMPLSMDQQAIVHLSLMLRQYVQSHNQNGSLTEDEIASLTVGKIIDLIHTKCNA